MKKYFYLILIISAFFSNISIADNIKDFKIEGMSVGSKLSDFMSINEIKKNTMPYFKDKRKYYVVGIVDNLKKYDQVEIYLKSNDKNYEIKTILAGVISDNIDKCIKEKKEIVKKLDVMFNNIKRLSDTKNHEADLTGNSKQYIDQYNINFPNHIRVECTEFSEKMKNEG